MSEWIERVTGDLAMLRFYSVKCEKLASEKWADDFTFWAVSSPGFTPNQTWGRYSWEQFIGEDFASWIELTTSEPGGYGPYTITNTRATAEEAVAKMAVHGITLEGSW